MYHHRTNHPQGVAATPVAPPLGLQHTDGAIAASPYQLGCNNPPVYMPPSMPMYPGYIPGMSNPVYTPSASASTSSWPNVQPDGVSSLKYTSPYSSAGFTLPPTPTPSPSNALTMAPMDPMEAARSANFPAGQLSVGDISAWKGLAPRAYGGAPLVFPPNKCLGRFSHALEYVLGETERGEREGGRGERQREGREGR